MTASRLAIAALLLLFIGVPLAWPLGGLFYPSAWPSSAAVERLVALGRNTAVLVLLVLLLAVPVGIVLAVLLEWTDIPGRKLAWALLILSLFVPLPLVVSGWQGVLGADGFLPLDAWNATVGWAPWAAGIGPASWVHAVAGLPWVVLIVGRGLAGVDRQLEEDELLQRGPLGVLWHVSLRRSGGAIAAAMLGLAVQTAGEITVTDLFQVRTFAEEVYTQFVAPEPDPTSPNPLARAVVVSLFSVAPFLVLVLLLARQAERALPAGGIAYRPAVTIGLGAWRWLVGLLVVAVAAALLAVPLAGLVWKAGLAGMPASWSLAHLLAQLNATFASDRGLLARSLLLAGIAGIMCAGVALVACWLARERRWLRGLLLVLLAAAWVLPGPVIGLGLKGVFRVLLDLTGERGLLAQLLWYGPSSLPLLWVYFIRLLPFAGAILWPAVRLVPRPLVELGRLDGAGVLGELIGIAAPALARAWLLAAGAVAVLSLGELAAGKLVSTPGAESYAEALFSQMHYGIGPDLAARSLWLLGLAALGAAGLAWFGRRA
jgi:iron(III) transport system permease protein